MIGPGILHRHVAKRFVAVYGVCLVFLVGLYVVMDLFGKLDEYFEAGEGVGALETTRDVALLYLLLLPTILVQVFPFVTLTAAVITSVRLRAANELVPMIAGGRSARVVAAPYFAFAVVVVGLTFLLQDHVVPKVADRQRGLALRLKGKDESVIDKIPILRDDAGLVIVAEGYAPAENALVTVTSTPFPFGDGEERLAAARIVWRRGEEGVGWYPEGGRLSRADGHEGVGPAESSRPWPEGRRFPLRLMPPEIDILVRRADPFGMTGFASWQLRKLIAQAPENDSLRFQYYFQLSHPLLNVVLLLIGVPLALRRSGRNTAVGASVCIVICALYFVLVALLRDVAFRGGLHPLVAAGAPIVIFTAAGLVFFDATRT